MESRQPKRMKKRRDLDKLLASSGRGLIVSKRRRLVGEHSSSEEAEFTSVVPDSNYRGSSRQPNGLVLAYPHRRICCCSNRCWNAAILTAMFLCVIALVGFGWLYIQLTRQLDYVQHKLYNLDRTRGEVNDIMLRLLEMERVVTIATSSEIPRLESNLTDMYQQMVQINATVRRIDQAVALAPELWTLPRQLKQLSKLVAELGSSMESLRQQQLVVDRRTDAMKTELVNLLSNNTNDIASCKHLMRDFNDSLMKTANMINITLWHEVMDIADDNIQQKLLMAKLSNDTELLHDLFSTTHVPATELSVAVIQTLKFIAQNETASQLSEFSAKQQESNSALASEVQRLRDRIDGLHVKSDVTDASLMEPTLSDLKQSIAQLTANVTNQLKSLHDITQRLTVIELTVDDVIPSRHGDHPMLAEPRTAATSRSDNRRLTMGQN